MSYADLKKSYDTARKEQLVADKELNRITKEIQNLTKEYERIDDYYVKSEVIFKNKELDAFRKSLVDPITSKGLKLQDKYDSLEKEYKSLRAEITYDNLLSQYSSKQEILDDVRDESVKLKSSLESSVGKSFYTRLTDTLKYQEVQLSEDNLDRIIKYFNQSEIKLEKMSEDTFGIREIFNSFERIVGTSGDESQDGSDSESPAETGNKITTICSVVIAAALLLFSNFTIPVVSALLGVYTVYTVVQNYQVYKILIVQKSIQDNIDQIDDHLKKQVEDEVNRQIDATDNKYLPVLENLKSTIASNKLEAEEALQRADAEFKYDGSSIELKKTAEIDKIDKQKSALLVQQEQQKEVLQEKTELVKKLNEQLNDMLSELRKQYLQGVGTSKILDPTFLFDIDPVRNKPIFFKHPLTSCLFLYEDVNDAYNLIRLLSLELRVKLNPFSLSIDVVDTKNMGQDFVYFTSEESEELPGGTKNVYSVITSQDDIKKLNTRTGTDLLRRQANIRREFGKISAYNEKMIELKSLTESYNFQFFIDPETGFISNPDVNKNLRVGGDLGVYIHFFVKKSDFKSMGEGAQFLLDAIGKVYYLEDGNYFERAKDFVIENLLSDED